MVRDAAAGDIRRM